MAINGSYETHHARSRAHSVARKKPFPDIFLKAALGLGFACRNETAVMIIPDVQ